jgi:hypothetical protein
MVSVPPTRSKDLVGLQKQAHLGDLIQKKGAPVGQLEPAFTPGHSSRKRALFMTEKFAFQERFRQRSAVYLDQGTFFPRTVGVNGVGHQFLSGAALTQDENGGLGGRNHAQCVEYLQDPGAVPYHLAGLEGPSHLGL